MICLRIGGFPTFRFDICPVIRKMLIFGEECEKAAVRSSKSLGECVWVEDQEEPPPQLTQFQARFYYAPGPFHDFV